MALEPIYNIINNQANRFDRTHDLTIEEVRQFDKYKDYSDEEIQVLIDAIKAFSILVFNIHSKSKETGRNIALPIDNQQTKAA